MKKIIFAAFVVYICSVNINAQSNGSDRQNERIRDAGSDRLPANNGSKTDVGTGRGIDFGRGRVAPTALLPNPLRITARRDVLMKTVEELMRERKLILDTAASKPDEGILISQPFVFSRGAIVTDSELNRYASLPAESRRNWTRGRYTLIVEVQPVDAISANVTANARIEAKAESVSGTEWVSIQSSGIAEQEFLAALSARLNGDPIPDSPSAP